MTQDKPEKDKPDYVATVAVTVPLHDTALRLTPGRQVRASEIPEGTLGPMLRLGQLVPWSDWQAASYVLEEVSAEIERAEEEAGVTHTVAPLTELALPEAIRKKLIAAELDSVEAILTAGEEGLAETKLTEKQLQALHERLDEFTKKQEPVGD